jgi:DNA-binding CsgD family transcriptional regulator
MNGGINSGETHNIGVLSDRELQIVELVAAGLTNEKIAKQLEISKRTVDNHISNILTKTGTDNRVALVRWALQWGKVCIDDVNCCTLPAAPRTEQQNTPTPQPYQQTNGHANGHSNGYSKEHVNGYGKADSLSSKGSAAP